MAEWKSCIVMGIVTVLTLVLSVLVELAICLFTIYVFIELLTRMLQHFGII